MIASGRDIHVEEEVALHLPKHFMHMMQEHIERERLCQMSRMFTELRLL